MLVSGRAVEVQRHLLVRQAGEVLAQRGVGTGCVRQTHGHLPLPIHQGVAEQPDVPQPVSRELLEEDRDPRLRRRGVGGGHHLSLSARCRVGLRCGAVTVASCALRERRLCMLRPSSR